MNGNIEDDDDLGDFFDEVNKAEEEAKKEIILEKEKENLKEENDTFAITTSNTRTETKLPIQQEQNEEPPKKKQRRKRWGDRTTTTTSTITNAYVHKLEGNSVPSSKSADTDAAVDSQKSQAKSIRQDDGDGHSKRDATVVVPQVAATTVVSAAPVIFETSATPTPQLQPQLKSSNTIVASRIQPTHDIRSNGISSTTVVAAGPSISTTLPPTKTTSSTTAHLSSSVPTAPTISLHQQAATMVPPPPPPPPPLPPGEGTESGPPTTKKVGTKVMKREAAGKQWIDPTMKEWPDNDFRLFVGNLGKEIKNEDLYEHFKKKYPSVAMVRIVYDTKNGQSKGFGFVSFLDPLQAAKAIREMNDSFLGARPMKVKRSDWKERDQKFKNKRGGKGRR